MRLSRLSLFLSLFSSVAFGQAALVCDNTCAPNPPSSDYTPNVSSRAKSQNLRGHGTVRTPVIRAGEGDMTTADVIGSQSVDYAVPIVSLPGRAGLDLNLTLRYNSRIWDVNPDDGTITLNTDRDFPSYGFRLDFGYIESSSGFILTEADGTKHQLIYTTTNIYDSNDGSHIEYNSSTKVLYYPSGLTMQYELFPSQVGTGTQTLFRPTQITDTNGNFISITYLSGHDQNINTVTDTLGRVITFNYSSGQLSSISEATGGSPFYFATFSWGSISLNYTFTSLTVANTPASGTSEPVITRCTLPDGTYYAFSYGGWGIVNRIDHYSANGTSRSYSTFDFPSASTALSDAPGYTNEYVSPDGSTTNHWQYTVTKNGTVVTSTTIADPSGAKTVLSLYGSSDPCPGAVQTVQMEDSSNTVFRQVDNTYDSICQLTEAVTTLSDTNQKSKVDYTYDSNGNVTDEKVYDFGSGAAGSLLRETATTYATPSYHILNLPTQVLVKNGGGTIVSRIDMSYDDTTPSSISGTINQHTTPNTRGNLTTVTRYTNASAGTGSIARTFAYDIVGNMITGHLDCCTQKNWNYSSTTQWAYPDSIERDPSGADLKTQATYDINSGLMLTSVDENSKTTSYTYETSTRRLSVITQPNSVTVTTTYDDSSANPAVTQSNSANSLVKFSKMDGLGNVIESDVKNSTTLVSKVTYQYDGLGRVTSQSNPNSSGSAVNTTTTYDALGRVTVVTPPSGGSYSNSYSGNTVTVTDPQSKQRKNYTDALGRLIEVDEPGDSSSGSDGTGSVTLDSPLKWRVDGTYSASSGSGSLTIGGGEQSFLFDDGSGPHYDSDCRCWLYGYYIYDSGTVTVTVGGRSEAVSYGQSSTTASIAGDLGSAFNGDSLSPATASVSGSTITFTAKATGASTNYSFSVSASTDDPYDFGSPSFYGSPSSGALSGGHDAYAGTTVYDTGTVTMTVGSFTTSAVSYGTSSNSTASQVASALASQLNGSGSPVYASASGSTISMTTRSVTSGSYSASVSASSSNGFSPASFSSSGGTVSGGSDPHGNTLTYPYTTTYAYDANGNLTSVSQGAQSRTYTYDSVGRTASVALPESGTASYTYYDHGRVNTRTDARGVVTTYTYNGYYQPTTISYNVGSTGVSNPGTVTFTYGTSTSSNNNGRLTNMSDGSGSEAYTYDNMGRVTSVAKSISSVTYTTNYAYNDDSTLQKLTYPSTRYASQTYDAIGRLSTISNSGSTVFSVTAYNDASQPTSVSYGNGVAGTYSYNDHLQLSTLKYVDSGSSTLLDLTYGYGSNNNGQIQTITDASGTAKSLTYSYDWLGRLSQATTNNLTGTNTYCLNFGYDRYGNRLSQTSCGGTLSTTNPNLAVSTTTNRITASGYAYDSNGNMTADSLGNSYVFDAENHMVSMNSGAHTYVYDGNGLRVKKDSTVYIYAGTKVVAEYASGGAAGSPSTEYVYSGSGLLQTIAGSITTYHHPDHLSNRVDTNTSGSSAGTFGRLPFGDTWYETGTANKWKFTSYERDSESNLDYAIARYNSSRLARFMSPDPYGGSANIANPQSLNRYSYGSNDPVNLTDPLGLDDGDYTFYAQGWAPYPSEGGGSIVGAGFGIGGGGDGGKEILPVVEQGGGGVDPAKKEAIKRITGDCLDFIVKLLKSAFSMKNDQYTSRTGQPVPVETVSNQMDVTSGDSFKSALMKTTAQIAATPNGKLDATAGLFSIDIHPGYKTSDKPEVWIHETFHVVPYQFTDQDLARALGKPFTVVPKDPEKTVENASRAWDQELNKHCGKK